MFSKEKEDPKISKLIAIRSQKNPDQEQTFESEINSLKFILKDSLFFKKFTNQAKEKKIGTEQMIFKSKNIIDETANYKINLLSMTHNLPETADNFEIKGICSKEIYKYFYEVLDSKLKNTIIAISLKENNIFEPFFKHIHNIFNKFMENVIVMKFYQMNVFID